MLKNSYKEVNKIFKRYHNNLLASHFSIKKTSKLLARKYYWLTFYYNIQTYTNSYDICLLFKAIKHKLYRNFWSLLIPTY